MIRLSTFNELALAAELDRRRETLAASASRRVRRTRRAGR